MTGLQPVVTVGEADFSPYCCCTLCTATAGGCARPGATLCFEVQLSFGEPYFVKKKLTGRICAFTKNKMNQQAFMFCVIFMIFVMLKLLLVVSSSQ